MQQQAVHVRAWRGQQPPLIRVTRGAHGSLVEEHPIFREHWPATSTAPRHYCPVCSTLCPPESFDLDAGRFTCDEVLRHIKGVHPEVVAFVDAL